MGNLDSSQWRRAQQTSLWKRTLGSDDEDVKPLRESFLDARKNAAFLLDKIRIDFPNLTVHDITHVDSLWSVADTIINKENPANPDDYYPINPLEGYILGIAYLIHDAALSYDAVGGKEKLRETIEWQDAYAEHPGDTDDEEFKKDCDFFAIRARHAENAKRLLSESFKDNNGLTINIHGNDPFLNHYGHLIGMIAASYHWNIDEVEFKLKKQKNPMSGMPKEWKINPIKLACILRCADAGHIDDGRAPDCIYQFLVVNGMSKYHWESQNRLCQVCEDEKDTTKLCITSSNPFKKDEEFAVESWNVAYDAIKLFDSELKKCNHLLKANHIKEFPHVGVSGAESKEDLAKNYIETVDWLPCNFGVHASDIKNLITIFGGDKLYGKQNQLLLSLREIIQNARDAIHARRNVDDRYDNGIITIRVNTVNSIYQIEIEDNGIGMTMNCIKDYLLDFGHSYWKSALSKLEYPGLRSSDFDSIGKYGIGFYSVFMVADSVDVYTRPFGENRKVNRIEFPKGLTLSPIISSWDMSPNISTKIVLTLKNNVSLNSFINEKPGYNQVPLKKALQLMIAGLDENVYFADSSGVECIHTSIISPEFDKVDWLKGLFVETPMNIDIIAKKLEILKDNKGKFKALLNIPSESELRVPFPAIETVSGLSTSIDCFSGKNGFIGCIDFKEKNISRNDIDFDKITQRYLQDWVGMKYLVNYHNIIKSRELANSYIKIVSYCRIDIDGLIQKNKKVIYLTSSEDNNHPIGSTDELRMVHEYMFAGLLGTARHIRDGFVILGDMPSILKNHLRINSLDVLSGEAALNSYNLLLRIEKMPNDDFEAIIRKFIMINWAKPFYDGNKRCAQIWANVMLKKVINKMIDWEKVDKQKYNQLMALSLKGEKNAETQLFEFLHQYLSKSYMMDS